MTALDAYKFLLDFGLGFDRKNYEPGDAYDTATKALFLALTGEEPSEDLIDNLFLANPNPKIPEEENAPINSMILWAARLNHFNPKFIRKEKLMSLLNQLPKNSWISPLSVTGELGVFEGETTFKSASMDKMPFTQYGYINLQEMEVVEFSRPKVDDDV